MTRARPLALLLIAALVAALGVTAAPLGAADPSVEPDLDVETWVSGVGIPWDVSFTPDGHALIPQRDAEAITVRAPGGSLTDIAADTSDVDSSGEGGLLGLVVDPRFPDNRRFYTCQTTSSAVEVIAWRMNARYTAASRVADPLVGGIDRTSGRHSGCRLRFGYEGYLWISTGDAARGSTPQDLGSLAGKVLRVDPRTGAGHPKNPLVGVPGDDRIYSYGHRNPQGLDRRPCTAQMWTGEHGPSVDDEINLIRRGGNYGWNPVPGYNESVPMTDFGLPGPQVGAKWDSGAPTVALSGIGWIRGSHWGAWDGELAGATLKNRRLMIFEFGNDNSFLDVDLPPELNGTFGRLRTSVMGPDGSLYVTSDGAGAVLRVTPEAGPQPGDQDIDGDGYDDLLVGAAAEDIGSRADAGGFSVLFGGASGLDPRANGSEWRSQGKLKGARVEAGDRLGASIAYGDVDGDGLTDVVVGSPDERVSRRSGAGAVHVICGRTNGVEARSSQTFSQAGSVAGALEAGDQFGAAVAMGDFDGDGYDDVAVGAPDEDVAGDRDAGAVTVLHGTAAGITTVRSRSFSQAGGVGGALEPGDGFGAALAVGDFDGDGYEDLAVGAPDERVAGRAGAGAVSVLFGSAAGLVAAGSQYWTQQQAGLGDNGAGDHFGAVLAAGDFDDDGRDDLAVGIPTEDVGGQADAGALTVLRGSPAGLTAAGATVITQGGPVPGANEAADNLGSALAVGDFDGDGDDDLAVGSSGENGRRGRILVLAGGPGGPSFDASFSTAGPVAGKPEAGDRFGASLASADFDGDGRDDLAVGSPTEDVGSRADAGAIVVLRGSASGLTPAGSRFISQATRGVRGAAEAGDGWSSAL